MIPTLVSDLARTVDYDRASGSVHSVFATSLNVELGGFLLHVGTPEHALSCLGMEVAPRDMEYLLSCVDRGDRAVCRGGALRLYGRRGVVEIDVSAAPVFSCKVPTPAGIPVDTDILICSALDSLGLPERMGLPNDRKTMRAISELARYSAVCMSVELLGEAGVHAVRVAASRRALNDAIQHLLGRGLGLTPSGDDVLCGFGTGLRFIWGARQPAMCDYFFASVHEALPGKTTAVAEAYLRAMVRGYANGDYLELLRVIAAGDAAALPSCLEHVLEVGHTSGADSLLGFGAAFCCLY